MGVEVLLDDRDKKTSPGVKFADAELIGIPHRVVFSSRGLKGGIVEYKARRDSKDDAVEMPAEDILSFMKEKLAK
jgi:prolyl-tRNA synthetase